MLKKVLLSFAVCICSFMTFAQNRNESEMYELASSKLQSIFGNDSRKIKGMTNSRISVSLALEMPQLGVYTGEQGGFVVISKDKRFEPILAYSRGNFAVNNVPCAMKWWLDAVSRNLSVLASNDESIYQEGENSFTPVAPLITTKWGQSGVFNAKTPMVNNKHTPTGCVATAMAQIMKYLNYPASAEFMGSYSVGSGANQKVYVNSIYDYNLPDGFGIHYVDGEFINDRSATSEQKEMVATLMYDCGVSVNMNYDTYGSGALTNVICKGLVDGFSYPRESVKVMERSVYTSTEWQNAIYSEIVNGYPVLYCGSTIDHAGHAFVAHGIDANGYLAINWGWNGDGDGFFNMDVLNSREGSYSENQSVIIGIRPNVLPTDKVESVFAFNSDVNYMYSKFLKSLIVSGPIYNFSGYNFNGELKYVFVDEQDGQIQEVVLEDCSDEPVSPYYGLVAELNIKIGEDERVKLIPGHSYILYGASQLPEEKAQGSMSMFRMKNGNSGNKFCLRVKVNEDLSVEIEEFADDIPETVGVSRPKVISSDLFSLPYSINGQPVIDNYRGIIIKGGKKYYRK